MLFIKWSKERLSISMIYFIDWGILCCQIKILNVSFLRSLILGHLTYQVIKFCNHLLFLYLWIVKVDFLDMLHRKQKLRVLSGVKDKYFAVFIINAVFLSWKSKDVLLQNIFLVSSLPCATSWLMNNDRWFYHVLQEFFYLWIFVWNLK